MSKVQVLFVDDEERLLSGIRRMLRDQRDVWDMYFASSGKEALETMRERHIDVIVSDMRMPEMDGAQLLSIVQNEFPDATRIILSGYADNESVLKTVGPSHRYLAKPCESEALRSTIKDALKLRRLVQDEGLRELVSGLKTIPTPSPVYLKLMESLKSDRITTDEIAHILSQDIALLTQTLKLTNSAYFGLPQRVTNIKQAVQLLGFETIKALATMANFYATYEGDAEHLRVLEMLNNRSTKIARLARKICVTEEASAQVAEAAFCAGLLAHVGTLILVANRPADFDKAIALVEQKGLTITDAETQIFGATHAALGGYLLGLWGFSESVVEAVAFHHAPSPQAGPCSPAMALHIAQFATRKLAEGRDKSERLIQAQVSDEAVDAIGGQERVEELGQLMEASNHE